MPVKKSIYPPLSPAAEAAALNGTFAPLGAARSVTLIVAASNASTKAKATADYVCTGTSSTGGDEAKINAAIAALPAVGGKIVLTEGTFYRTAPIVCDSSYVVIEGSGQGATTIQPATNATGAANLIIGSTSTSAIPQNVELRDLFIQDGFGSSSNASIATSKHGLIFRCNNGRLTNVRATHQALDGVRIEGFKTYGTATTLTSAVSTTPNQASQETWNVASSAAFTVNGFAQVGDVSDLTGDTDPEWVLVTAKPNGTSITVQRGYGGSKIKTHASSDKVTPFTTTNTYDLVADGGYSIFAGRSGVYTDPWSTDCEFRAWKVDGGDDLAHARTVNGFYITGAGMKFALCHPYFCSNAGLYANGAGLLTQTTVTVEGGDYETNGAYGIQLNWAKNSKLDTYFHDNTGQNVGLTSSQNITISGFAFASQNLTQHIYADGCSRVTVKDYIASDGPALVQVIKFVNGCTRMRITGCHLSPVLDANYAKMINLGNSTYSEVDHNLLEGSVWEDTGADYNQIRNNVLYPLNPAPSNGGEQPNIHLVGAHSVSRGNTGIADPTPTKDPRIPQFVVGESIPRWSGVANTSGWIVSGRMHGVAIPLTAGDVVNSLAFLSGTTALSGGSNQWFALFDPSGNKVGITADDTSNAWAANTLKGLALTSTYIASVTGLYTAVAVIVATTPPSLLATSGGSSILTGFAPVICGYGSTGLTNPASCPSTLPALTALPGVSYAQARS